MRAVIFWLSPAATPRAQTLSGWKGLVSVCARSLLFRTVMNCLSQSAWLVNVLHGKRKNKTLRHRDHRQVPLPL